MESGAKILSNRASIVLIIAVAAVHWLLSYTSAQCREVLVGFGFVADTQLPALTQAMMSGPGIFSVVPVLCVLLVVLNRALIVQKSTVLGMSMLATLGKVIVFGVAVYLPVRQMGAIVQ